MTLAVGELVRAAIIAILAFLAIVVVLGACMLWLRHKALMKESGGGAGGFSVEGLEELRRSGRISKEEFSRLRRLLLGMAGEVGQKDSSSSSSTCGDDDEEDSEEDPCVHRD